MSNNSDFPKIITGNAIKEGLDRRGWFVGAFIEPHGSIQSSNDVEIKWGIHPEGEERSSLAQEGNATTISILLKGEFQILFEGKEVLLTKEGDYFMMFPNQAHSTKAIKDSVILTIRWPSLSSKKN